MPDEKTYSNDEIATHLEKNLPNWYFENGWIRRKYKTSGWKGTLMVINTIGHLAEAAWHHPDISASYAFVIVKLQNHAAKGITDKDFLLAKKIEDVPLLFRNEKKVIDGTVYGISLHKSGIAVGGHGEVLPNEKEHFGFHFTIKNVSIENLVGNVEEKKSRGSRITTYTLFT